MSTNSYELRPDDYRPVASRHKDIGIGIIGFGDIVRVAHMPAYRDCGYNVIAACDIDDKALNSARNTFGIENVSKDASIVLDNPDVQIVDLAVHTGLRKPLIEKIIAAGKHVFSQKPFAMTLAEAREMVAMCERGGVKLMVNQQSRWAPAHRAIKVMLDRGVCGHVYSVFHFNRSFQDQQGSWYIKLDNFNLVDHGIHFIDLSRHFSGMTPKRVYCTTTPIPGQRAVSPMIYDITLEYDESAQCMGGLHFNNIIPAHATHRFEWCIDGTEGSLIATQEELVFCPKSQRDTRFVTQIHGRWFPDAFGGSMGEMLDAVAEDREPLTSGRDNLKSIAIADAALRSSESHEAIVLATE